jgi:hypothetical protein
MALALTTLVAAAKPATAAVLRAEVSVHGSAEEVRALEATLRSLFPANSQLVVSAVEAVDVQQVMREPLTPSTEDVVARAWIELHDGSRVTIYVADVSGERILVRHLPRSEQDELVKEATARIVATALEALLSGAQIGVERAKLREELVGATPASPPTAPPAPPRAAPASPRSPAFTLGAHYGVQLFSSQIPLVHGPGLVLGVTDGAPLNRLGALLVGQVWWPSRAHDDVARVRVYSGAFRLLVTVERSFGRSVALSAGLGGGIDLTRVEPAAGSAGIPVQLAPPKTLLMPALRASFGTKFRLSSGLSLYTTLALDADPSGTRYVSLNDGVATELLEPHTLRPGLVVGVATP